MSHIKDNSVYVIRIKDGIITSFMLCNVYNFCVFIHKFIAIKDQPESSVPALTALPRKEWASIRKEYFSEGLNRQALEAIEEALFVVRVSYIGLNKMCSCICFQLKKMTFHEANFSTLQAN